MRVGCLATRVREGSRGQISRGFLTSLPLGSHQKVFPSSSRKDWVANISSPLLMKGFTCCKGPRAMWSSKSCQASPLFLWSLSSMVETSSAMALTQA